MGKTTETIIHQSSNNKLSTFKYLLKCSVYIFIPSMYESIHMIIALFFHRTHNASMSHSKELKQNNNTNREKSLGGGENHILSGLGAERAALLVLVTQPM